MDVIERLKRQRGEEEWECEDDLFLDDDDLQGYTITDSIEEYEEDL